MARTLIMVPLVCMSMQAVAQQQIVDPDFQPMVAKPAYPNGGPAVAIDEAHDNFHTLAGQYAPLAALLRTDGYKVVASKVPFEKEALAGIRVLIVANARNLKAILAGDISKPAFTDRECDVIADWVRAGGSLLLVADHAPFGNAADTLARRFGVTMGEDGFLTGPVLADITTQLDFSRHNGLLGKTFNHQRTQQFRESKHDPGVHRTVTHCPCQRDDPDETESRRAQCSYPCRHGRRRHGRPQPEPSSPAYGSRSTSAAGRAQGLAMPFGTGRIVVLGEAALLSAQIIRYTDPQPHDSKIGMNTPGNDDRQFALNILHWLSGLLN